MSTAELKNAPQGVVAIFANEKGREIASVSDFNPGSPCGFTQQEAQRTRARDALAMEAVRALSSPVLSGAVEQYVANQIMDKMIHNGCRTFFVPIGYDSDSDA